MEPKDYILISISIGAFTLSLISLIVTLVQKNKETKRSIRKSLTDALEGIVKINIETTKLSTSKPNDNMSEELISLRRNFNTQRRVLIEHACYLVIKYNDMATEIDCSILAGAFATIGDPEKAKFFWQKTIEKSKSNPIKQMNLRGFGRFCFKTDQVELGRKLFNDALSIELPEGDIAKTQIIDTLLMLADEEKDLGNTKEFKLNLDKAIEVCSKIKIVRIKEDMISRIEKRQAKPASFSL